MMRKYLTRGKLNPTIPEDYKDLFTGNNFAHVATLMPDGSPQVTPVWVDLDGDTVLINSAEGRLKVKNLDRDGRIALSIHDQSNPYRYIQVRGVAEKTREGAEEHIDALAKKYMGVDKYPLRTEGEARVIYRIRPERVNAWG
jgi:PPOX class probable F420-dependent enzyme